jgi:hypothetical protein
VKRVLTGHDDIFGPWIIQQCGGNANSWHKGRGVTIGLWEDGVGPVAGQIYENCNGTSIVGHLAGVGKRWMNREFLWYCFYYPFIQLGVKKIIGPIYADNLEARRLVEHMGFSLEATLKDAAPKGDLLLYTITEDACRWLKLKDFPSERRKR